MTIHTRSYRWTCPLLLGCALAGAQKAPPSDLKVSARTYIQYPSLNPVSAISLQFGIFGSSAYAVVQNEAANPNWNCASPQFYSAAVVDKTHKVLRQLTVDAARPSGFDPTTGLRYTSCKPGHPAIVDLVLGSQVNTSDLIQVFIYEDVKHTKLLISSDGTLSFTASNIPSFTATPQAAPGETLNNGTTRTVGQLNIAFSDTNLLARSPVNLYAKSADLLSTDGKDAKSAVSVTGGIQRGAFSKWYRPVHLEQTIQGNQTAKNLSTVTSFGLASLPKWHWTRSFLNNSFVLAPLPFEPSVAAQYTHRFNQLVTSKTPMLSVNDLSLNPALSWSTISFPFTCKILFWEKSTSAKVAPNNAGAAASTQQATCLGTELDLGLWYLPLDLTAAGSQRADGYGDVSILVPLSDFSVASKELTYVTGKDPTKFQIRIKYADAVNAANNYARTKQWTFGIEALK